MQPAPFDAVRFDESTTREKKEPTAHVSVDEGGNSNHIALAMQATTPTDTTTSPIPTGCILAPGDPVTITTHTDAQAAYVVTVSPNGRTATIRHATQKLLNGCNSGEPDALRCHPGGFAGHVEGKQRWSVEPNPAGAVEKVTLRKQGAFWFWKRVGCPTKAIGNTLRKGHCPHYDFNF